MLLLLTRRKILSSVNALRSLTAWECARNTAFLLVGMWMLAGLYFGFLRVLRYLNAVQLIGPFLIWKLTAMILLTTFAMVVISSLIISLTTFFYSYDLPFLMEAPLDQRTVFMHKSVEAVFFSSWMIGLVLFPYMLAMGAVMGGGGSLFAVFLGLLVPFMLLATVFGMGFTLILMRLFPSPRTRDVIWVLSSFSIALVYVVFRLSQPEKLVRPDLLQVIAQYIEFLQAPTARYLPSWWMTQALSGWVNGKGALCARNAALLVLSAAAAYAALVALAGRIYSLGYSGAQEGRWAGRSQEIGLSWEDRVARRLGAPALIAGLCWKERKSFFRDVSHWSQLVLIAALLCVYLYSIQRLPLDSTDLKSLASFVNLVVAGFVISSLGLRFTFPSLSLEGRSFWVLRCAPIRIQSLMCEKFLFSVVPMTVLSSLLILMSNHLLQADRFISWLSFGTIVLMTWTLCGMGVGFGAIFPRFNIANIHQIESSAGGFVYMAACLFYVGMTVALEAPVVQMHFHAKFGRPDAWNWTHAAACAGAVGAMNILAFSLPWFIGRRALEQYEE